MVFCPRATMAYAGILAILSLGQYCGRHAGLYTDPTGFRPTMILLRLRVCLLHGPYVSLLHMRSGNIYRNPSDTSPHRRFPPSILCPPDPKTHRTCSVERFGFGFAAHDAAPRLRELRAGALLYKFCCKAWVSQRWRLLRVRWVEKAALVGGASGRSPG